LPPGRLEQMSADVVKGVRACVPTNHWRGISPSQSGRLRVDYEPTTCLRGAREQLVLGMTVYRHLKVCNGPAPATRSGSLAARGTGRSRSQAGYRARTSARTGNSAALARSQQSWPSARTGDHSRSVAAGISGTGSPSLKADSKRKPPRLTGSSTLLFVRRSRRTRSDCKFSQVNGGPTWRHGTDDVKPAAVARGRNQAAACLGTVAAKLSAEKTLMP
jgi:hypothetical protein